MIHNWDGVGVELAFSDDFLEPCGWFECFFAVDIYPMPCPKSLVH